MDEEIIIDDDLDFQFRELVHELWALGVHLDALEEQIVFWRQQDSLVSPPPLTEDSIEYEDVLAFGEWQEHLDKVEYALPRLLRSSFVVLLWAVYEAAVNEIARILRRRSQLGMADLRGDFTDRSNKYFAKVLELTLHSSDDVRERLQVLEVVRHAIAHANGRLTEVRDDKNRRQIHVWIKQDRGISEEHGCIMLSQGFLRQGYADVKQEIERLIAIAKAEDGRSKASTSGTSDGEGR